MIDCSGTICVAVSRRIDDQPAARETLADIVVGLAFELQRHALGHEGPEALAGRAGELHVDRVVRQAGVAVALGDLARQHGARGAVDIGDRQLERDRRLASRPRPALLDQRLVEHLAEIVVLRLGVVEAVALRRLRAGGTACAKSSPLAFQCSIDRVAVEHLDLADHLVEGAEAQLRHELAHFLGDEEEEVDDVLGLADEALAQHRVLRRDADRAGVEVALAHHDAAGRDQRRGRAAELVGAEQRARSPRRGRCAGRRRPARAMRERSRFSTSVCWVSARPISHGQPACLIEVSGEAPVPPSKPAIVTWSARALETPAATVPTPISETSLTETSAVRVDVLQVVDELRQILDRIDVVVRRRRDQADAGRRVPHLGDDGVDLVAGQLAAFAGLGPLRHLDLHHVRVDEILRS